MNACTKSAAFCNTSGLTVCGVVLISTCGLPKVHEGQAMMGSIALLLVIAGER